jgi:holo-[acyl-carrier protein] synthase
MAVVGLGLDLVEIPRLAAFLERRGVRALERLFTPAERAYCERRQASRAQHYAGRFAAKEAVMKLLGTGWTRGVRWIDIEVVRAAGSAPLIQLHGATARIAQQRNIAKIHLAITHDGGLAAAVAVGESA